MSSKSNQSNESNENNETEWTVLIRATDGGRSIIRSKAFTGSERAAGAFARKLIRDSGEAVERVAPHTLLSLVGVIEYPQGKGNVSV
jgi:hypothetical protein